jgi:hypothetical protein
MRTVRGVSAVGSLALVALATVCASCASGAAYTLYSENDVFAVGNRDRYYTNGLRLTGLHSADATPDVVRAAAESLPDVSATATTQIGWVLGQDIYTPADTSLDPPDEDDRPYGGWLYAGVLVSKAVKAEEGPAGDFVHVLELDLGVVGPPSLADQTQVSFHHVIGSPRPQGWRYQLGFEPAAVATYEHRRRLLQGDAVPLVGGEWDAIGVGGLALGTVFTHASLGGMFRWGSDLRRDFGPNTIHSTAVDVPDAGSGCETRWYVFGGAEGRAVARNIFLDGNTWRDSPSVERDPWVGELRAGIALEWNGLRFSYTHAMRSGEFDGQDGSQAYGSLALTFGIDF